MALSDQKGDREEADMSAIGYSSRYKLISANADYRRSDFIFPRTQSLSLRDAPWGRRLSPMRSWAEIGTYGAGAALAASLIAATLF